jgi:hypothetical protein
MSDLGSDFGGGADLSASLSEQYGRLALADAIVRRLTTERGGLPDYPQYGFDVSSLIGTIIEPSSVAQRVLAQVRAEEEVSRASLDIETSADNSTINLKLQIVSGDGPFPLTISVSDLGVTAIIPGAE